MMMHHSKIGAVYIHSAGRSVSLSIWKIILFSSEKFSFNRFINSFLLFYCYGMIIIQMLDLLDQSLCFPIFFLLLSFPLSVSLFSGRFHQLYLLIPQMSFSFLPLSFYIPQELLLFLDYFFFITCCYLIDMVLYIPEDCQLFFF